MFRSETLALIVLICLALPARADDGTLSGWVRLDLFSSTLTLDDRVGAGSTQLGLKYGKDIDSDDKLRFEGNFYQDLRDEGSDIRLIDSYWQHRNDWLDLRLGVQKISWGKTDGLNPTDFFTPHDYTVLQPFEADQRRSVLAMRADITTGDGQTLSVVVEPDFIAERQPESLDAQIAEHQPNGLHRPQAALRWSSVGDELDWSVSAFHGFLNSPLFGADATGLFHHYAELDALGADVAHNFGHWGFRAEAAWLDPHGIPGETNIQRQLYAVAGVDRGEDDWNINLQMIARYTPNFQQQDTGPAGSLAATAALQNAINFGQLHEMQYGFTSRLAGNWLNQTLQAELLVIDYVRPGNALIRPLMTYAMSDVDHVSVGGDYYTGPAASFFGQLEQNRTVFFEYQHFF